MNIVVRKDLNSDSVKVTGGGYALTDVKIHRFIS